MKFNIPFLSHLKRQIAQALSMMLLVGLVWQGMASQAMADVRSPLLATSADSISKQVSGKVDKAKGATKEAVGKAQSSMENRKGEIDRKVKDGMTEAKVAAESTATRAENGIEKAADSVKDFFGQ